MPAGFFLRTLPRLTKWLKIRQSISHDCDILRETVWLTVRVLFEAMLLIVLQTTACRALDSVCDCAAGHGHRRKCCRGIKHA